MTEEARTRAKVFWEGGLRTVSNIRGMELRSDKPKSYYGTNTGPAPMEIFVASIGKCFLTIFLHAAMRSRVEVADASVDIKGHTTIEKGIESMTRIELKLTAWAEKEHRQKLEKAMELSKEICALTRILTIPIEYEFVLKND
jgi:uncharacterized OsmC-like protein